MVNSKQQNIEQKISFNYLNVVMVGSCFLLLLNVYKVDLILNIYTALCLRYLVIIKSLFARIYLHRYFEALGNFEVLTFLPIAVLSILLHLVTYFIK